MAKLPKYLNASEYNITAVCEMIAKAVLADPNYADMLGYTMFAKDVLKYDTSFDLKEVLKTTSGTDQLTKAIYEALSEYSKKFIKTKTRGGEEGDDGDSLEKN